MKAKIIDKLKRRITYRGWHKHIGRNKRIHFEEGRKKNASVMI